jgi:hypothetical protein
MIKISKQKIPSALLFLAILMISGIYLNLAPAACAEEISNSSSNPNTYARTIMNNNAALITAEPPNLGTSSSNTTPLINGTGLSDYSVRLLQDLSTEVNATQLERIRQEMVNAKLLFESKESSGILSAEQSILDSSKSSLSAKQYAFDDFQTLYLQTVSDQQTTAFGPTAMLNNSHGMEGSPNFNYVRERTVNYNGPEKGDEVIVTGDMGTYMTVADVWLLCYTTEPSVVFVCASNNINTPKDDWQWITQVEVIDSGSPQWFYVGCGFDFRYISVDTWATGGQNPHNANDLFIDSVCCEVPNGYGYSTVLTISSGQGGTTNPQPGGYYYFGQTAEVTAIPDLYYDFSYWYIDNGNYQSTDNPLSIQTSDGDHYVTAYFTYDPDQQWIIIDYGGGGYTSPLTGTYAGSGSMQITATADAGFAFSYWLLNGNYLSSNPTISVDYGANEITPVFYNLCPPVIHQLTVYAINTYNEVPLYPNIYVDSCYVGSGYATVQVTEGSHDVEIDSWYGCYYCYGYSNNWNSPIYSDTEMEAYYNLGG